MSAAGDVNGDGFDDILIGASAAIRTGFDAGESYVVFGKAWALPPALDLASLNGTNGFRSTASMPMTKRLFRSRRGTSMATASTT